MPRTITRFPPSPTGALHVGGARTALFNWLYAKKTGGQFVFRLEDTDRERSTQAAADNIIDAMRWLGLDWDQGPHYQSRRLERYAEVVRALLDASGAYYCFCGKERVAAMREAMRARGDKPRYDGHCRELNRRPRRGESAVVRFKSPTAGAVVFNDQVRGRVSVNNDELDDLIIARADGSPTYHLCAVVDDIDAGVTHVIRGDDHLSNTPRQINLFTALGARPPVFAHVPMITARDGRRLSKRDGATSVLAYRDAGILAPALLNYLARLGWSSGDREIFSRDELIGAFDLAGIHSSPAAFDKDKLLWMNQSHMRAMDANQLGVELGAQLARRGADCADGPPPGETAAAMQTRAQTLTEMADQSAYLYGEIGDYETASANKFLTAAAAPLLTAARDELAAIDAWHEETITRALARVQAAHGVKLGALAQPLRVALSGAAATPAIAVTIKLVGQRRACARIQAAVEWINAR